VQICGTLPSQINITGATSEGNNQMIKPIAKMLAGLNGNLPLSENASSSVNI
jgi:hypothetical protein